MRSPTAISLAILGLGFLTTHVAASDVLKTDGFEDCSTNGTITVNKMDIEYVRSTKKITFDVSGTSSKEQNVTAKLTVSAYGSTIYTKSFDPCDTDSYVEELCPVPSGTFSASGTQSVPDSYASQIPSIAFSIPDLEGEAKLELKAKDGGEELACIQSTVTNGKTVGLAAVSYIAAGIAGVALAMSALSALGTAGDPGATSSSPGFIEIVHWFQSMATNGMLSVNYPTIYRKFTKNFAFSTGLVSWSSMQRSIDNFRAATGGNLTHESYDYLQNTTLVYSDGSNSTTTKRAINTALLFLRNLDTRASNSSDSSSSTSELVSDAKAYFEQLSIPSANVFMTVLLIFAILIAVITCGILLFKVILEAWALTGSFPKKLTSFRKNYWWLLARTITSLILLLYSVWVLYCVYQFTHGDSWAAKVLAGITLSAFTGVLAFYGFRIWQVVQRSKRLEGDDLALYNDKSTWTKYRIFYENFRSGYWWFFVPVIVYMFAKGCILAAADGHGLVQASGQLICEAAMLILLIWSRPYNTTSGKWINIVVQVVRVLSVICVLVFVDELGIAQTTKTITGVALIVVQAALSGILAILIGVNAIITCVRQNPHRKRRKEAEKLHRDDLTPLDARDSLLMEPTTYKQSQATKTPVAQFNSAPSPYEPFRNQGPGLAPSKSRRGPRDEEEASALMHSAADMGQHYPPYQGNMRSRSLSRGSGGSIPPPSDGRNPTLPNVGGYDAVGRGR